MSEREDIHKNYEDKIKEAATGLATDAITYPELVDGYTQHFAHLVSRATKQRDRALAELDAVVNIERRHLVTVRDWIRKVHRAIEDSGYVTSHKLVQRNPACFGHCTTDICGFPSDSLCEACRAITAILGLPEDDQ